MAFDLEFWQSVCSHISFLKITEDIDWAMFSVSLKKKFNVACHMTLRHPDVPCQFYIIPSSLASIISGPLLEHKTTPTGPTLPTIFNHLFDKHFIQRPLN